MTEKKLTPTYTVSITCPICEKKIQVTKVRSKFVKLDHQDEDFCPYYETINPVFYEAWVCSSCGYAAHSSMFEDVTQNDQRTVLNQIAKRWTSRDFSGDRDLEKAMEAFKIVLYNLQIRSAPPSEFGKICLRIAWLYRYNGEWVNEYKYLENAYNYYKNAYSKEHLIKGRLDEYTCMYIIGEIARRLDKHEEALRWYGKLLSASINPKEKTKINPVILQNLQDQIYTVREEMKTKKKANSQ